MDSALTNSAEGLNSSETVERTPTVAVSNEAPSASKTTTYSLSATVKREPEESNPEDVYNFHDSAEEDNVSLMERRFIPKSRSKAKKPELALKIEQQLNIDLAAETSNLSLQYSEDEGASNESSSKKVPPLRITLPKGAEESAPPGPVPPSPRKSFSLRGRRSSPSKPLTRARIRQVAEDVGPSAKKRTSYRTTSSSLIGGGTAGGGTPDGDKPGVDEDSDDGDARPVKPPISPPTRAYALIQENPFAGNLGLRNLIREKWSEDLHRKQHPPPEIPRYEQYMINTRDYARGTPGCGLPKIPVSSKWPLEVQHLFFHQARERQKLRLQQETARNHLQVFGESEFLRAKLGFVVKERTAVNANRLMREEASCNPLNFDNYHPEPVTPSMVPQTPTQAFSKIRTLSHELYSSQITERDAVIQRQRSEFFNMFRWLKFSEADSKTHCQHCVLPWHIPRVNFSHVLDPDNPELSDDEETEIMKALEESLSKKVDCEFDLGTVDND